MNPVDRGLLVLTSLAGGEKHGYAIMLDVEDFAGVRLGPGSLYGALERLEDSDLVVSLPLVDRRRPYQLTAAGERLLADELAATAELAREGLARLKRSGL